jgi:hypothetical protein
MRLYLGAAMTAADLAKLMDTAGDEWIRAYRGAGADGNALITPAAVHALNLAFDARRAARAAGYVECLLSREAVAALRLRLLPWGSHHPCCEKPEGPCTCGEEVLARDLAALLKEPT